MLSCNYFTTGPGHFYFGLVMGSGIGCGAAGSALASGGGVTAAVLWLLDMENCMG